MFVSSTICNQLTHTVMHSHDSWREHRVSEQNLLQDQCFTTFPGPFTPCQVPRSKSSRQLKLKKNIYIYNKGKWNRPSLLNLRSCCFFVYYILGNLISVWTAGQRKRGSQRPHLGIYMRTHQAVEYENNSIYLKVILKKT